jgi:hypothetical protein
MRRNIKYSTKRWRRTCLKWHTSWNYQQRPWSPDHHIFVYVWNPLYLKLETKILLIEYLIQTLECEDRSNPDHDEVIDRLFIESSLFQSNSFLSCYSFLALMIYTSCGLIRFHSLLVLNKSLSLPILYLLLFEQRCGQTFEKGEGKDSVEKILSLMLPRDVLLTMHLMLSDKNAKCSQLTRVTGNNKSP